jgi:hypothetical protein
MKALFAKGDGKVLSDASRRSEGAMPLLRRIWLKSGKRSSRAILPVVRIVTCPSMRGSID